LEEGVSTRLLVYAAKLMGQGLSPRIACEHTVIQAMTDDPEMQEAIAEIVSGIF
jgi:nitric oxide reductase NorQ protein